jgi:hypothetical protein
MAKQNNFYPRQSFLKVNIYIYIDRGKLKRTTGAR